METLSPLTLRKTKLVFCGALPLVEEFKTSAFCTFKKGQIGLEFYCEELFKPKTEPLLSWSYNNKDCVQKGTNTEKEKGEDLSWKTEGLKLNLSAT